MNIENKDKKYIEIGFMLLFAVSLIVITIFHEPWFDEAQSWQIARCASYKDMIFNISHFEGHPALWWLILSIPAKLGVPYELGLKAVGFIFSIASVYLLLFKSPFPRIVKCALPFTYFLFYQYGVIVRPYCVIFFLLMLLAIFYEKRNEKPVRYVLCMCILCALSSYLLAICAGLAIAWVIEICEEKGTKEAFRDLFNDQRSRSLLGLLAFALLVVVEIFPADDVYYADSSMGNNLLVKFIATLFTIMPEVLFLSNSWFTTDMTLLSCADVGVAPLITATVFGIFVWFLIWGFSSKRTFRIYVLSYVPFAIFSAVAYFTAHHSGIALFHLLFWAWITYIDDDKCRGWNLLNEKGLFKEKDLLLGKKLVIVILVVSFGMNFYWTASSCVLDIQEEYFGGKAIAELFKEKGFDELNCMCGWTKESASEYSNPYLMGMAATVLPYFESNFVDNFNMGKDDEMYVHHRECSQKKMKEIEKEWTSLPLPDITIGQVDTEKIFKDSKDVKYYTIEKIESITIFKGKATDSSIYIFMREDLLDEYGYEKIDILQESIIDEYIGENKYKKYQKYIERKKERDKEK